MLIQGSKAKVADFEVPVTVQKEVFRFNICLSIGQVKTLTSVSNTFAVAEHLHLDTFAVELPWQK